MAVLSDAKRLEGAGEHMSDVSNSRGSLPISKADLRAAFNALDVFFNDNASNVNQAIPLPARTALSQTEKARLVVKVITKRYLEGVG